MRGQIISVLSWTETPDEVAALTQACAEQRQRMPVSGQSILRNMTLRWGTSVVAPWVKPLLGIPIFHFLVPLLSDPASCQCTMAGIRGWVTHMADPDGELWAPCCGLAHLWLLWAFGKGASGWKISPSAAFQVDKNKQLEKCDLGNLVLHRLITEGVVSLCPSGLGFS